MACDQIMAVRIPETAVKLRRLMNLAQIVQSHALSFFHLSSPDLLLGMDAPAAEWNIFGLIQKYPQIARDGIRLRAYGQSIIEWLGGKRVHPTWVVPGGVSAPLAPVVRDRIAGGWLAMAGRAVSPQARPQPPSRRTRRRGSAAARPTAGDGTRSGRPIPAGLGSGDEGDADIAW